MRYLSFYRKNGILLILIFLISQHIFSVYNSNLLGYSDINNYIFIADNGFKSNVNLNIPLHHLERWPIHILIGYLSILLKIEIHYVYILFQCIVLIYTFFLIEYFKTCDIIKLSIFSLILFNPYLFRLYFCVPEMISDSIFLAGSITFIVALLNANNKMNLIGLFLMIISRQTVLLLVPIILIMYLKNIIDIKKLKKNLLIILIGFLFIKLSTRVIFNVNENNGYILYHLLVGWKNANEFNDYESFYFIGRFIILLISISPLFLFVNKHIFRKYIYWILFFFIINAQPLISGPLITSGNIQRLGALGIPFLLPILISNTIKNKNTYKLFILLIILLSFHHRFSVFQIYEHSLELFKIILLIVPIIIILYINVYVKK